MEGIAVEYFPNSIDHGINENKSKFHSYISDYNEQYAYDSHTHVFHIFKKIDSCQQYGKTPMVVPSNKCVPCIYI